MKICLYALGRSNHTIKTEYFQHNGVQAYNVIEPVLALVQQKMGGTLVTRLMPYLHANCKCFIMVCLIFAHIFGDPSDPSDPAVQLLHEPNT